MREPDFKYLTRVNCGWSYFAICVVVGLLGLSVWGAMNRSPDAAPVGTIAIWAIVLFLACTSGFLIARTIVGVARNTTTTLEIMHDSVHWHTPWPQTSERTIPLGDIRSVTVWTCGWGADKIAVRLNDGSFAMIPTECYNGNSDPVVLSLHRVLPTLRIAKRQNVFGESMEPE
jgi:hypothetical protein